MGGGVKSDLIDMAAKLQAETDKSWMLETENGTAWIPKSQAEFDGETLTLPEWLAIQKELV